MKRTLLHMHSSTEGTLLMVCLKIDTQQFLNILQTSRTILYVTSEFSRHNDIFKVKIGSFLCLILLFELFLKHSPGNPVFC